MEKKGKKKEGAGMLSQEMHFTVRTSQKLTENT
jgi:hypothetical protein